MTSVSRQVVSITRHQLPDTRPRSLSPCVGRGQSMRSRAAPVLLNSRLLTIRDCLKRDRMRATDDRLSFLRPFVLLSCLGIVVCILYFAQGVLIPLALAVLLTFLLAPPVMALQRRGLPRVPAVIVVVIAAFVLFSGIAWLVVGQATSLVDSLPDYEKNLHEKIDSILAMNESGFVQRIEGVLERLKRRIERSGKDDSGRPVEPSATDPLPVRVVDEASPFNLTDLWVLAAPLLGAVRGGRRGDRAGDLSPDTARGHARPNDQPDRPRPADVDHQGAR